MKIVRLLWLVATVNGVRLRDFRDHIKELTGTQNNQSLVGFECPFPCACSIREGGPTIFCCECGCECHCIDEERRIIVCCECSCFPGDATLTLEGDSNVSMKNLKAGDRIKTVSGGKVIFTEVKTFLKRKPETIAGYLEITTSTGASLTLSDDHLVFVSSSNKTVDMEPRFAVSVKVGEYLFTTGECNEALCPSLVSHTEPVVKNGAYVPLTEDGTLVVNGVLASCYASINHDIAHVFTTPFRWCPWILSPWQEDGYSPIVKRIKQFGHAILPNSLQFQKRQISELPQKRTEL